MGEPCGEASCDPTAGWCAPSGVCEALKYRGERCEQDEECLGGDCNYVGSDERRCDGPCKLP